MSAEGVGGLPVTLTTPDNLLGGRYHTPTLIATPLLAVRWAGAQVWVHSVISLLSEFKSSEVGGGGGGGCQLC